MMTLKRVFRSLRRRPRYAAGFLLAGVLGLSCNLYLDSLEGSIRSSLGSKSRELLTGDVEISVRRLTTDEDRSKIDSFVETRASSKSRSLDLFSMLSGAKGSRLSQINAVESNFPLVGRLTLEKAGMVEGTTPKPTLGKGQAWIDPDLRDFLGLEIGESVKIGEKSFRVTDIILDDTSNTWKGFTLAPRIFISNEDLFMTGLIRKGSTLWDRTYFNLKPGITSREVAKQWNAEIEDPALRATPHEESSEQVAKLTSYLNDYLGLVGLTTLFLAIVGISFLFQTELRRRLRMIGTLRALGDSTRRIGFEISLEAMVLGVLSAVASLVLVWVTLPFASRIVSGISGVEIHPALSLLSASVTLLLGALVGFGLAFPFASRVTRMKPGALFQDEANLELPYQKKDALLFGPLLLLFYLLSVYHAHSWRVGSLFFALSLVSILGLYGIGLLVFRRLERVKVRSLSLRLGMRSLARNPWSSLSGFVAVGIGSLLLSLIPSLQGMIESEIERPVGSKVPSLFLFDIQPEQLDGVKKAVEDNGGKLDYVSPMIRARLESLKGLPVNKALDFAQRSTREQEEEERSRNRGFNLSYRADLADSESLTGGRNFTGRFNSEGKTLPEITIENKFADRLGVGLGDVIGFDIQGIPIEAKVVGLRRVRWSSFQPNFFIIFQPGALDDAPKTFLAGVPGIQPETRKKIQSALVTAYPNVSLIQVDEMVKKLLKMFDQMGMAVKVTAGLALLTGIFVLFTIARRQVELRRRSALLLKTVGASSGAILGIFLWEFGILSLIASVTGAGLSVAISKLLAWILFDRIDSTLVLTGIFAVLSVVAVVLIAVVIAAYGLVREKPWRLLQSDGDR